MCWWNHPQNAKSIFIPCNTSEVIPGESGVAVVLQNLSGRDIILEPHAEFGMVTAANIVPSVQIPDRQYLKESEEVQCKSAQAEFSEGKTIQEEIDSGDILQKI